MLVYHGSILEIYKPDVAHSKNYMDFGKGFYTTTFPKQAERWAARKALRSGKGKATVNVYELKDNLAEYRVLQFEEPEDDEEWLDFVCACRDGAEEYKNYDIIIGGVANDDVFKTVDMYRKGAWDKVRTLKELKYFKKNNQIAFVSQTVLDDALSFKYSYVVEVR